MIGNFFKSFVVLLLLFVSPVHAQEPFWGVVKKVIDGDSLLIVSGRKTIEVRLYGVDSPEYNQPFSKKARELLRNRVLGEKVLIRPQYSDPYKRLVAIVLYEDHTLNDELVSAGLAWVYPHYCRKNICTSWKEMENSARAAKRGLWSAPQPIQPWRWRVRHGNQK